MQPAGSQCISRSPLLRDPYERRYVVVRRSLQAGAGEGLAARTDLKPGTTAALFNGVRQHKVNSTLKYLKAENRF